MKLHTTVFERVVLNSCVGHIDVIAQKTKHICAASEYQNGFMNSVLYIESQKQRRKARRNFYTQRAKAGERSSQLQFARSNKPRKQHEGRELILYHHYV